MLSSTHFSMPFMHCWHCCLFHGAATGAWAGAEVAETDAKLVVRSADDSRSVTQLIPLDSIEFRALMMPRFKLDIAPPGTTAAEKGALKHSNA